MFAIINVAPSMNFYDRLESPLNVDHRTALMIEMHDGRSRDLVRIPTGVSDALTAIRINMVRRPFI